MIDLPRELTDEALRELLIPGMVFLFINFPGKRGPRDKYFVLLSRPSTKGEVYYALTTTRGDYYDENPLMEKEIVRIHPGALSFFDAPRDTIIQCHLADRFKVNTLYDLYHIHEFIRKGPLPKGVIEDVLAVVENSEQLPLKYKKEISLALREHLSA